MEFQNCNHRQHHIDLNKLPGKDYDKNQNFKFIHEDEETIHIQIQDNSKIQSLDVPEDGKTSCKGEMVLQQRGKHIIISKVRHYYVYKKPPNILLRSCGIKSRTSQSMRAVNTSYLGISVCKHITSSKATCKKNRNSLCIILDSLPRKSKV